MSRPAPGPDEPPRTDREPTAGQQYAWPSPGPTAPPHGAAAGAGFATHQASSATYQPGPVSPGPQRSTRRRGWGMIAGTAAVAAMGAGGISGAPVAARSRAVLARIHSRAGGRVVIVSVGGVETAEDVWDRITHGAHLVQTYTGFIFAGTALVRDSNRLVARRLREGGFSSLAEAVGSAVG